MKSRKIDATSSKSETIRLRHSCATELIGKVNKKLSPAQKQRIEATPFRWLLLLPEKTNVSGILLEQLARRWDNERGGFRIGSRYVDFTPLDVCYAIGLGIVGEDVKFVDDLSSHTLTLLEGEKTTLTGIYNKLSNLSADEDVDDFCRLYILLAMEEFLFPNTNKNIHCGCIKLLDDLDSLGTLNWGFAVYDYLCKKLKNVSKSLVESKEPRTLYLSGCVVVLQVWGLEHVWPHHKGCSKGDKYFPRCLKWSNVYLERESLLQAFEKNQVYDRLNATNDELVVYEVRQALAEAPDGYRSSREIPEQTKNLIAYNKKLEAEHKELKVRISKAETVLHQLHNLPDDKKEFLKQKIGELQRQLEEESNTTKWTPLISKEANEGYSPIATQGNIGEPSSSVKLEPASHHQVSNVYTRRAKNPRMSKPSAAIQTPYQAYGVSKKKRNEMK